MKAYRKNARTEKTVEYSRSTRRIRSTLNSIFLIASLMMTGYYLTSPPPSNALSNTIVISAVYGNAGTNFLYDYIELFNRGNTPVNISGWSVQVAVSPNGANSSNWQVTPLCPGGSCIIPPHTYFLVGELGSSPSSTPTPDVVGTINVGGNSGKVALVNNTTQLAVACPTGNAAVIDFVGYGSAANCSEGNSNAPNPGNQNQAICRKQKGFQETDNNGNDFEVCDPMPNNSFGPTDAELITFNAYSSGNGRVLLEWQTGFEVSNLGFNIYRDQDGKRTLINSQLIAGSALSVGLQTALTAGRSYSVLDKGTDGTGAQYWLEDLDLEGNSTWHGPITTEAASDRRLLSDVQQAASLDQFGANASQDATTVYEFKASAGRASAAQVEVQARLAARPAIKIAVQREGWYRVTLQELTAAGFDPNTDARFLQLFVDGKEQAIAITGTSGNRLNSSSAIEFYGIGLDDRSTDSHIYRLVAGSKPGARITIAKTRGSVPAASGFLFTTERKDRTVYFSSLKNGDKENFFGSVIARTPVEQLLVARNIDRAAGREAALEVALQGVTDLPHRVKVMLNDSDIGEVYFEGQAQGFARILVPQSALKEGNNPVQFISLLGDKDISLLDYVHLTYWHTYTADNNALRLTASGKQQLKIGGFNNSAIRVLDISDPNDVSEVVGTVQQEGSYSISFTVPGKKQRTLLAFASDQVRKVAAISFDQGSNWRTPKHAADLVIITRREFESAVAPLINQRRDQGLRVAIVDVEDLYDEFSFGNKSPQAIKDFLAYAKANWQAAPSFVLMVGDASLDPKNYLGYGDFDFVPTNLIDTQNMETASDDWFADFDGDGLAEMALGRLPVRNAQEATTVIAKIVGYATADQSDAVLLISDSKDGYDFAAASAQLRSLVPSRLKVEEINRSNMDTASAKSQLLSSLNRGAKLVNYVGHGSIDLWKANLLTTNDAKGLTNGETLPLFVTMTCLNGYFQDAMLESLAEALVKAERGGAIAVWASSGMTKPDSQSVLNRETFRALFGSGSQTLGEITVKAKAAVRDSDIRRTWVLFGDPSMKLK